MSVLVFQRRDRTFNEMVLKEATRSYPDESLVTISEYAGEDIRIDANLDTASYSCRAEQYMKENMSVEDVVLRDRVLRNISFSQALVLVRRTVKQLLDVFENNDFIAYFSYPVDNYVTDIAASMAKQYGVNVFGLSNFFIPGYKRSTVFGEHHSVRSVTDHEVECVLSLLRNSFVSPMAPKRTPAIRKAIIRYVRNKARYAWFYLYKHKLLRNFDYDYISTPYVSTVRSVFNFFSERFFTKEGDINFNKHSILLPLHYFPEATIEYWSRDRLLVEFEDMFFCKLDEVASSYEQVIVKEHPAALFDNNASFYRRILQYENVVLADPFIPTNQLLMRVGVVGCWTGTSAVEAFVNDVPVELYCDGQYYNNNFVLSEIRGRELHRVDNKREFIREVLSGCIKSS